MRGTWGRAAGGGALATALVVSLAEHRAQSAVAGLAEAGLAEAVPVVILADVMAGTSATAGTSAMAGTGAMAGTSATRGLRAGALGAPTAGSGEALLGTVGATVATAGAAALFSEAGAVGWDVAP